MSTRRTLIGLTTALVLGLGTLGVGVAAQADSPALVQPEFDGTITSAVAVAPDDAGIEAVYRLHHAPGRWWGEGIPADPAQPAPTSLSVTRLDGGQLARIPLREDAVGAANLGMSSNTGTLVAAPAAGRVLAAYPTEASEGGALALVSVASGDPGARSASAETVAEALIAPTEGRRIHASSFGLLPSGDALLLTQEAEEWETVGGLTARVIDPVTLRVLETHPVLDARGEPIVVAYRNTVSPLAAVPARGTVLATGELNGPLGGGGVEISLADWVGTPIQLDGWDPQAPRVLALGDGRTAVFTRVDSEEDPETGHFREFQELVVVDLETGETRSRDRIGFPGDQDGAGPEPFLYRAQALALDPDGRTLRGFTQPQGNAALGTPVAVYPFSFRPDAAEGGRLTIGTPLAGARLVPQPTSGAAFSAEGCLVTANSFAVGAPGGSAGEWGWPEGVTLTLCPPRLSAEQTEASGPLGEPVRVTSSVSTPVGGVGYASLRWQRLGDAGWADASAPTPANVAGAETAALELPATVAPATVRLIAASDVFGEVAGPEIVVRATQGPGPTTVPPTTAPPTTVPPTSLPPTSGPPSTASPSTATPSLLPATETTPGALSETGGSSPAALIIAAGALLAGGAALGLIRFRRSRG